MNNKRIYVGNLNWVVNSFDLGQIFKDLTVTKAIVVRKDGRSCGYGFVEFETEDDANRAMSEYNKKQFYGREIIVNPAYPDREETKSNIITRNDL